MRSHTMLCHVMSCYVIRCHAVISCHAMLCPISRNLLECGVVVLISSPSTAHSQTKPYTIWAGGVVLHFCKVHFLSPRTVYYLIYTKRVKPLGPVFNIDLSFNLRFRWDFFSKCHRQSNRCSGFYKYLRVVFRFSTWYLTSNAPNGFGW